ncbi:MAG: DUF1156 domain-containing protein [Anaerolineae bacterium]|nr:DUF1156 domain-containing protein [Anaerolineae bacterium]
MSQRKKLIEVGLPLDAINEACVREKSIRHGHPNTLHLWWARRPLASTRAIIFASLVDDPDNPNAPEAFREACKRLPEGANTKKSDTPRMRLFDFIESLVKWEATTNENILKTARELIQLSTGGNIPPLLDPFAGGGSIPIEAQRLGLEAHASDLNPIAVLINKALIEIPPRFADKPPVNPKAVNQMTQGGWQGAKGLAADVRYYGNWMLEQAKARIGHLYPTHNGETVIAWLWARTVKCPNPACPVHMPLITSFELSRKSGKRAWLEPQIANGKVCFIVRREQDGHDHRNMPKSPKIGRGARFKCLACGEVAPEQYIKAESIARRMGVVMTAIVTDCDNQRSYYAADENQQKIAESAVPQWKPSQEMYRDTPNLVSGRGYGFFEWADLFSPRQLTALTTLSDLVVEARKQIEADALAAGMRADSTPLREGGRGARAYAEAVSVYLAFAVDKCVDYNSTLCHWHVSKQIVRNTFGRHALPMVWDYLEANLFSEAGGSIHTAVQYVAEVVERLGVGREGKAYQQDARTINYDQYLVISTDPPYYDNIGYADLSDFFYVWLRPMLRDVYPDLFSTRLVPKEAELIAAPHRHGGNRDAAKDFFEGGMRQAFRAMRSLSHMDYPLTIYYAYKQRDAVHAEDSDADDKAWDDTEATASAEPRAPNGSVVASSGWETMLSGLLGADFNVVGTYPMRTELATRMIARGTNSLASSVLLVCKPRPAEAPSTSRRQFLNALRKELPEALHALQMLDIAPVDMAQASIGPGMAVFSRYKRVLEMDGKPIDIRTALAQINQTLEEYLTGRDADMDAETRLAVQLFEQFAFNEASFGEADVVARAKNTSVESLVLAGIAESGGGKVRLKHWTEYDPGAWAPEQDERATVWEAVHHLIERLNTHGEQGAAELLNRIPPILAGQARQLLYRLYDICDRRGRAKEAFEYNKLAVMWADISALARQSKQDALV